MLEILKSILHIDVLINQWAQQMGPWLFVVLFLIIFCETGLVVTPFLPGDSLLFAVGALSAAQPTNFEIHILIPLIISAAIIGDSTNYFIGKKFGRKLFEKDSFFFRKKYLEETELFYAKHGGKSVFLARFFPILRTFAPFVGGLSVMPYRQFLKMSVLGSLVWVNLFALAGFFFGQIPFIQKNFTYLVMGIVLVSLMPFLIALAKKLISKPI